MKLLKMFGLIAVAALLVVAFVGTGTAMAETTALCKDSPPYDLADQDIKDIPDRDGILAVCDDVVTHVHETSVVKAKLLTKFISAECDVSFLGDALAGLVTNGSVVIHGTFTYTNCGSCTVTQEGGATIAVLRLGHETGDVAYAYQMHQECGSLIDCKYNGTGLVGTAKGPLLSTHLNGGVTISEQTLNSTGGGLCFSSVKLDIETTPLELIYIGS